MHPTWRIDYFKVKFPEPEWVTLFTAKQDAKLLQMIEYQFKEFHRNKKQNPKCIQLIQKYKSYSY